MAASEWIQLHIHPDDAEILRIAELTGQPPDVVYACVLRWFFHVDRQYTDGITGVGELGFNRITRWPEPDAMMTRKTGAESAQNRRSAAQLTFPGAGNCTLAEAMMTAHVGWLSLMDDGTLYVEGFDKHFGRNAKRRSRENLRKREHNAQNRRKTGAKPAQNRRKRRASDAPQQQQLESNPPTPLPGGAVRAALAELFMPSGVSADDERRLDRAADALAQKVRPGDDVRQAIRARMDAFAGYYQRPATMAAVVRHWDALGNGTRPAVDRATEEHIQDEAAMQADADARRAALADLDAHIQEHGPADVEAAWERVKASRPALAGVSGWHAFPVWVRNELLGEADGLG